MQLTSSIVSLLFAASLASALAVETPADPISELEKRGKGGTTSCRNDGLIGRPKYDPKCLPSNSKGKKSAHNCSGKSYLCVLSGQATCYSISDAKARRFENGECFL